MNRIQEHPDYHTKEKSVRSISVILFLLLLEFLVGTQSKLKMSRLRRNRATTKPLQGAHCQQHDHDRAKEKRVRSL